MMVIFCVKTEILALKKNELVTVIWIVQTSLTNRTAVSDRP